MVILKFKIKGGFFNGNNIVKPQSATKINVVKNSLIYNYRERRNNNRS